MRAPVVLLSLVIAIALAAGVPPVSASHQQKDQNVFVGHGKIARRHVPDTTKPESSGKPDPGLGDGGSEAYDSAEPAAPPAGHTIEEIEELEQDCLREVNHQRIARGLSAMEPDRSVLAVARAYSRQMAEEGFFSHVDPDGRDVRQRLEKARITWLVVGENLSYSNGYINPVAISLRGWMDSPGHRHNILDARYNTSAIGAWIAPNGTVYFTEIFLKIKK
jgi:uncharacterized protein YkwD